MNLKFRVKKFLVEKFFFRAGEFFFETRLDRDLLTSLIITALYRTAIM